MTTCSQTKCFMDTVITVIIVQVFVFVVHLNFYCLASSRILTHSPDENSILAKTIFCALDLERGNCPEDGAWTNWGPWGDCHGTCGQTGLRHRYRTCTNPAPSHNGEYCSGQSSESKLCRLNGCTMLEYREAAKCNDFRMEQFEVLDRVHDLYPSLATRCIEAECHYEIVERVLGEDADEYWNALHCVKHNAGCPEYGGWSSWTVYSDCTAYCGQGHHVQCRTCTNPIPVSEKYGCRGENCSFSPCSGSKCDIMLHGNWNEWNSWSECSVSCGQGLQQRTRTCTHGKKTSVEQFMPHAHSAYTSPLPLCFNYMRNKRNLDAVISSRDVCTGPYKELKPCYVSECPVDGEWSEWEPWSQCSTECSLGLQSRSRACSSPPPMYGGETCVGPVTWIRHCFSAPCLEVDHGSAFFRGDGSLNYYKTSYSSRLLHLYIRFKPSGKRGELVRRESGPCTKKRGCTFVKLYLNAGHVVLRATIGVCPLVLATYRPVMVGTWTKVLVTVTSSGAAMRIDDSESYYRGHFNCWVASPDFDGVMTIGQEFRGEISNLVVNYVPRYLKSGNDTRDHQQLILGHVKINLAPFSAFNVFYNEGEGEEKILTLDNMIFAPCFKKSTTWSIKLVVKTDNQDGALMIIKDYYRAKYLILMFEPYRVVVQLEDGICFMEVYHLVEHHVGEWMLINIDYDQDASIGLEVNGGPRKEMVASITDTTLSCVDNIMIGDVAHLLTEAGQNKPGKHTTYLRSMKGHLAYLSVDGVEIDLSRLPSESMTVTNQLSSEAASISKNYVEYALEMGKPFELGCLYFFDESSKDIYARVNWNYSGPIWLYSTIPIIPNKRMSWGGMYSIEDKKFLTILSSKEYTKESIEGFYSCWLPSNAKTQNSPIVVTFGVTVMVHGNELKGSHSIIVNALSILLLAILLIATTTLLFEYFSGLFDGMGLNTQDMTTKCLDKELRYVLFHSPDLQENFGVTNKLVKNIQTFKQMLEEDRAKNRRIKQVCRSITKDALITRYLGSSSPRCCDTMNASTPSGGYKLSPGRLTSPQQSPSSLQRSTDYDLLRDPPRSPKTVTFSSSTENITMSRASSKASGRRNKVR